MMLLSRSIPAVLSFLMFAGFVVVIRNHALLTWVVPTLFLLFLLLGHLLMRQDFRSKQFWLLLLTPLLLNFTALFFLTILTQTLWQYLLAATVAVVTFWFLQNVFQFLHHERSYQPYAIENISTYANLLSVFFFTAALTSLELYLNVPQALLLLVSLTVFTLLVMQMLWVNKIELRPKIGYLVILPFVFTQVLWASLFLPTNFFIAGLLVTLSYYAVTNISRHHLLDRLEAAIVRRYLIIALLGFLITLSTAQWT